MTRREEDINFESNNLGDRIGTFYSAEGVAIKMNISPEELTNLTESRSILNCKTLDGMTVYPTFQFTKNGKIIEGIPEVIKNLSRGIDDGWTQSMWLITKSEDLYGESAIKCLAEGKHKDRVIEQALICGNAWIR